MADRIDEELELLRKRFCSLKIDDEKKWILLPNYPIPEGLGWNKEEIDICMEVKPGFPGVPPYGIYVPADLRFDNSVPKEWQCPANNMPSFPGEWALISWQPQEQWIPGADVVSGSNLLNFALSFTERFKAGI